MKAITKFLGAGAAAAALAGAAPAAAQYYPGYGSYGPGFPYGVNPYAPGMYGQGVVNQCANAVQVRLSGGYGGYGYGYAYGYGSGNPYGGGGRVLGISRVEQRENGGLLVRGVASSGRYGGYGYASNSPDLVWSCRTDFRGAIVDIDVNAAVPNYGYQYSPWSQDYSQYGYYRY